MKEQETETLKCYSVLNFILSFIYFFIMISVASYLFPKENKFSSAQDPAQSLRIRDAVIFNCASRKLIVPVFQMLIRLLV